MVDEECWKINGIKPLVTLSQELFGYLDQVPAKIWNSKWGAITVKEVKFSKYHQEIDDTHSPAIREIYNLATVFNRDYLTSTHTVVIDAVRELLPNLLALHGYSIRDNNSPAGHYGPKELGNGITRSLLDIKSYSLMGRMPTEELDGLVKSISQLDDATLKVQAAKALERTINEKMSLRGQVSATPIMN